MVTIAISLYSGLANLCTFIVKPALFREMGISKTSAQEKASKNQQDKRLAKAKPQKKEQRASLMESHGRDEIFGPTKRIKLDPETESE